MNIPTLNRFTPSVDYEIKTGWGVQHLSAIQKDTGLSIEQLIKRAKFLGINGGKEKNMSMDDMEKLSRIIGDTRCSIVTIVKKFPNKQISSLYLSIAGIQKLSGAEKYQGVAQNFLAEDWSEREKEFVIGYVMNPKKDREARAELCRMLPSRTKSAISQRINITTMKLKKQGVIIPTTIKNIKKSDFMVVGDKIKVNEKAIPEAKKIIEENYAVSYKSEKESNQTPVKIDELQSIKKDIMKLIDEMHPEGLESTRRYKHGDLYIKLDLWRKQD